MKKSINANKELILQTEMKIDIAVSRLKNGNPNKDGLGILYYVAGLFGQRLWFYGKTKTYKQKPKVDKEKCIGCGRCSELCPMKNIAIENLMPTRDDNSCTDRKISFAAYNAKTAV